MEILTANGDNVTAAALAATMGTAGMTGTVADPTKRAQMQSAVATAAAQQPAASLAGMYSQPNLAMMHPAFRPNLSLATHQSIQVINCFFKHLFSKIMKKSVNYQAKDKPSWNFVLQVLHSHA